jgi:hypothetical protein
MGITVEYTDIIDKKFDKLTVRKFVGKKPDKKGNSVYYLCQCDCGKMKETTRVNLMAKHTRSCGCLKRLKGKDNKCWQGHGDISSRLWSHIKKHAENRNLDFTVSIEEAWDKYVKQDSKCELTGWPIVLNTHKGAYSARTASLDRIDNAKGYEKGNIQWLHKDVNWMKGKFATDRFMEICKAVTEKDKVRS